MADRLEPMRRLRGPHRRFDPLGDQWVLVSADRTDRPWQGSIDAPAAVPALAHDPGCYLCPGSTRASGATNPAYESTFVFTNDFAALQPEAAPDRVEHGLFVAEAEAGTCRVVCYDPRHDLSLGQLPGNAVRAVIDVWADETATLGGDYRWVQVFENRGEAMGASNPHPHGQVWAGTALPREAAREAGTQAAHWARTGSRLLLDYVDQERGGDRTVIESDAWLVVVPFWAVWPFETLVIPKAATGRLPELGAAARDDLATVLIDLFQGYDRLFDAPFPSSWGWHQAPFDGEDHAGWQLHAHVYPPLLRSATVRKFMVGYELLAEPQRDIAPEDAAARLRAATGYGR